MLNRQSHFTVTVRQYVETTHTVRARTAREAMACVHAKIDPVGVIDWPMNERRVLSSSVKRAMRVPFDLDGLIEKRATGCWLWRGTVNQNGYGQISIERRSVLAHRLMWERIHGAIPVGMQVCHRCDVRNCVNPAHLFLGTAADNQHDKKQKGRAARGERNGGGGKLTAQKVQAIRRRCDEGESKAAVAEAFGVTATMVGHIVRRTAWAHVA